MDAIAVLPEAFAFAGAEEEPMPQRQATNNDIMRVLGRLEESSEESKRQRNEIQIELREAVGRIAILTTTLEGINGDDGKLAVIERRVARLEGVADMVE